MADPTLTRCASRSALYGLLAEALDYPDPAFHEAVVNGRMNSQLQEVLGRVHPDLAADLDWRALADAGQDPDALAVEYTRLFDSAGAAPRCSLVGGSYGGARIRTMEEVLRFYQHFGLTRSPASRETPDHIIPELEFLHYLSYGEWNLRARSVDPGAYMRGLRDFIARHPGRWLPIMREQLLALQPMAFFAELVRLVTQVLQRDLVHYEALLGKGSLMPACAVQLAGSQ